jgi:hypothetical protein
MVYGGLSPSGEFTMQGGPDLGAEKSPAFGVEIVFHRENDLVSRTLYYFSTDLAAGLERDPRLPRFLHRFGMCDTLLKSASFLPHWRMSASIRDYILQNSNLVLQDDTGVPFRDFEASKWHVQLFGAYSHPESAIPAGVPTLHERSGPTRVSASSASRWDTEQADGHRS